MSERLQGQRTKLNADKMTCDGRCSSRRKQLMGLLQLRYEHDSSTIRARFGYNTLRDAYDSSLVMHSVTHRVHWLGRATAAA